VFIITERHSRGVINISNSIFGQRDNLCNRLVVIHY